MCEWISEQISKLIPKQKSKIEKCNSHLKIAYLSEAGICQLTVLPGVQVALGLRSQVKSRSSSFEKAALSGHWVSGPG